MRLSKIKLAGFKSFVDPTAIHFPSNLIGIVGPNGCGKSNVIDAVRWVLGETSAKHLRGDSMADVIFNGSSARKPVGNAAIELVFDNSDGTITGQYAGYAEISIRRVVSRDGTSTFYLNGARCRRKDITHLFLGTGLGSRSYAIIEQGMISRLIEAKPEELRAFLEEAAGISRYKERRRETEHRIRHTKDNLSRLNDLREEVENQIKHLQRQASVARRYQKLKQEERRTKAESLALRLRDLNADSQSRESVAHERDIALQAAIADQRAVEAAIEKSRESVADRTETLNEIQGRYYKQGAEIARLEQTLQHGRELRQRQQGDLEQATRGLEEIRSHIDKDRGELATLEATLEELQPGLERARTSERSSGDALLAAEAATQQWQQDWEGLTHEHHVAQQRIQIEQARIEHLEKQLDGLQQRHGKTEAEHGELSNDALERQLQRLVVREEQMRGRDSATQARVEAAREDVQTLRDQDRQLSDRLHQARETLQQRLGRVASLEALQQAALGQTEGAVTDWLAHNELAEHPRLAQRLSVEAGWERAVETVLGAYLEAVCVDGIDAVAALLGGLEQGSVNFVEASRPVEESDEQRAEAPRDSETLIAKIHSATAPESLLGGISVADTLTEAMARRDSLRPGESIIIRDGIWIGADWLRVSRDEDERSGVLGREQEIRALRQELSTEQPRVEKLDRVLRDGRARLRQLERRYDASQEEAQGVHRLHAEVRAQLHALRARVEQMRHQRDTLTNELGELGSEIEVAGSQLETSRRALEEATATSKSLEDRRAELEQQRERLQAQLRESREQAQAHRVAAQDIAIRVESRRSTRVSATASLERMESQSRQFEARRSELERQLEEGEQPLRDQQEQLEELLGRRVEIEGELTEARRALEVADHELRDHEQQRTSCESKVDELRQLLDAARMAAQEVRVRREAVEEQFETTAFDLDELLRELPDEAQIEDWEEKVAKLGTRIDRLGPINLAAIDELEEQTERKQYLDAQNDDLVQALETLENAIRRIDRETRTRFKETFDRVNTGLKEKFPRLFGGGHAYLELTGDDLLSAGVTVMARPPGKRNSTIHLLSGGEKALTAVALVFSIFDLKPAPFCLLDEVDAPLDDANVGRFCDIVREMSAQTQFVVVTHNKSTMELTDQLIGVTMNEPGVSRLVVVDVDEAVRMAAM